ncbi:MAG: ribonuclease III [Acidobacteriota bacterium]
MTSSSSSNLSRLEEKLRHRFKDRRLLQQALTHKSYAHEAGSEVSFHNESMEFLGDAVLGFLITDFIYHGFLPLSEGRKSKIKAYLVSSVTLASLARELDLPSYLRLGKGEEKTGGRRKKALSANAFEAVVAALYLDGGVDVARAFLEPTFQPLFAKIREGRAVVEDPKTSLQEYLQARNLPRARYVFARETGPDHRKTFHVELLIGEQNQAVAIGPTKKKAELRAARDALEKLRKEEGNVG